MEEHRKMKHDADESSFTERKKWMILTSLWEFIYLPDSFLNQYANDSRMKHMVHLMMSLKSGDLKEAKKHLDDFKNQEMALIGNDAFQ